MAEKPEKILKKAPVLSNMKRKSAFFADLK